MSETDALRALMEADRWIDRVTSQRNHLPEMAELATLEDELRALLKALQEAQVATSTRFRRAYEDAPPKRERLRKRENDLATTLATSTANARELSAIQNELTTCASCSSASEDRELELSARPRAARRGGRGDQGPSPARRRAPW